jgi:GNAT superfamily N-acetyltransferase
MTSRPIPEGAAGELIIRVGSVVDHEGVRAVWQAANAVRRGEGSSGAEVNHLGKADAVLFVAVVAERIVGAAMMLPARAADGAGEVIAGLCHISMVCVEPGEWGRGIGARLVDRVIGEARELGFEDAQLWTQADNARAQRLYEHRGFVRSGREKAHGGESIVHYTRSLAL